MSERNALEPARKCHYLPTDYGEALWPFTPDEHFICHMALTDLPGTTK